MADITKMTLDEMIDAGLTLEQMQAALKSRIASREKELEKQRAAEAAEKARQEEIAAARRQYKKAHAKYMKAITGEDMTAEEMAEFEKCVCLPMEGVWEMQYAPKKSPAAGRRVMVNGAEVASEDELIRAIMKAIGEIR